MRSTENLFTPWRYSYLSGDEAQEGCFLCAAQESPDDPASLVVGGDAHHLVILNRYPYTNGHLLIAPREHRAAPRGEAGGAGGGFWALVLRARTILESEYRPDGFNMGMNLGSAAGAGVPDHWHFHVVPRWSGDTNFASVVGGIRVVPEELGTVWERLRPRFAEEER